MHYQRMRRAGTLDTLPLKIHRTEEMLEDYDFIVETEDLTVRQAAERMGVSLSALRKALYRRKNQ